MSDDDDDVHSSAPVEEDYQNHPRIYHVLRDFCDVPKLDYQSTQALRLPRHGKTKSVVIVATIYYIYLFKRKGLKLYTRWAARYLSVARKGTSVYFSLGIDAETVAAEHQKKVGGGSSRRKKDDSDDDDDDDADLDIDQEDNTFTACRVVCEREASATLLAEEVRQVIYRAKSIADKHKREEEGRGKRRSRITFKDDPAAENEDEDEMMSHHSDDEESDDPDALELQRAVVKISAEGAAKALLTSSTNPDAVEGGQAGARSSMMLQNAPGRYIAVASLVDGEFADYTALKNAYLRNEDGSLLEDLKAFIADQEQQVEAVCRAHYPAFLHAAEQCSRITSQDAEIIRDELMGAMRLVRDSASEMKEAASLLLLSRGVQSHMGSARSLLAQLKDVAESLETTESYVMKKQLLGAAISLETLTSSAGSVAEFALGAYVLHVCIPRLKRRIILEAQAQLNRWLTAMRSSAEAIGRDTILQRGHERVTAGKMVRKAVVSDDRGGSWAIVSTFQPATAMDQGGGGVSQATAASVRLMNKLPDLIAGASVQRVFTVLGLQEVFRKTYADARAKQLYTDILDPAHITSSSSSSSTDSSMLDALTKFCHNALGSLILEDLAIHTTRPAAVRSDADIIVLWDGICSQVALLVHGLQGSLLRMRASDDSTVTTVSTVLELLTVMNACVRRLVTSTYLNPLGLARVSETLSNRLQTLWVDTCCTSTAMDISMDPLSPISIKNATEFQNFVTKFHFHRCTSHELPIPVTYRSGSTVNIPYAIFVPAFVDRVVALIINCFQVQRSSEVNNFDDMMLKFLHLVFRTAHSVVQGRVQSVAEGGGIQLAVLISSCTAMCVAASIAEMELTTHCGYGEEGERGRQVLGSPILLEPVAALFRQLTTTAIEKLNGDLQRDVTATLLPTTQFSYWRTKFLNKKAAPGESRSSIAQQELPALASLGDLVKKRISPLKELLQPSVFKSLLSFLWMHIIMSLQLTLDQAVNVYHDENTQMMKNCVAEFRQEVKEWVPRIRTQLDVLEGITPGSAQSRNPVDFDKICADHILLIDAREREIIEEREAKNPIVANLDAARQAGAAVVSGVAHGVADVTRLTGKGIIGLGKIVKNGITNGGGASTPRSPAVDNTTKR
ncbi:Hypothetical protein, putative [Bodo saltans]|uniref:Exocyst complex component EXOC6/Sec15 N-terminal domain-containing protein n=1 Tax=Bodo saltans TaxID=75058 RepID=A0A0S4JSF8_BODSA|nr:Hypothetical protein, putative [Bodo saltans]|eukprot:CUG94458.1 Hypothetical protein, putative [Bodo saltans]